MRFLAVLSCISFLTLSGCALGPDYIRPPVSAPDQFLEHPIENESIANVPWWDFYNDEILKSLIRTAVENNRDIASAAARIEEAEAMASGTRADQFPRLDGVGIASRISPSKEVVFYSLSPFNLFGLGGLISYEADIWGKYRRATEAERALLLSNQQSYRLITLSLVARVAATYFVIQDLDRRMEIARSTHKSRIQSTKLIRARFSKGIVPELDVNQAEIEEADAAISLAESERLRIVAENLLRVLLGGETVSIPVVVSSNRFTLPAALPVGVPAALLERRPDVAAAEETAKAAVAQVGVAEASRFPSLSLSGLFGIQSRDSSDLFGGKPFTWTLSADAIGPIIDFGKSKANVDASEARVKQAYASYQQAVLKAVQEVNDALARIRTYTLEHELRLTQVKSAKNAARLSRARYDEGAAPYLEVLDTERSLFTAELAESETYQLLLTSGVELYRALGGGWMQPEDVKPAEIVTKEN